MYFPNSPKPAFELDFNRKIFVKENVFGNDICNDLIAFGKTNVNKGINKYPGQFSVSFHSCLLPLDHPVHEALQATWNNIHDFYNIDFDFIEPYELKRYTAKDFFGKHNDNYYGLNIEQDRKLTLVAQLTDITEYDNGELTVLNSSFKINKGSIVCFPSYFPHAVNKITSGTRWSLIGWAWGPYWK